MANLRWLYIYSSLEKVLPLVLSYLSLPVDKICSVTAISTNHSVDRTISFESFLPLLVAYTHLYLVSYAMLGLGVMLVDSALFTIVYNDPVSQDGFEDHSPPPLSTPTIFKKTRFPPTFHSRLIKGLSTCDLSQVKKLTLTTSYSGKVFDPTDPEFHTFLVSLTGVETLIAPEASIEPLNNVNSGPVFPSLKTLMLDLWSKRVSPRLEKSMKLFFARRIDAGILVAVLDISKFVAEFGKSVKWFFLESVKDLKATWSDSEKNQEYICGRGSPEKLEM